MNVNQKNNAKLTHLAGKPHARFDEGGQARTCSLLYPKMFRCYYNAAR